MLLYKRRDDALDQSKEYAYYADNTKRHTSGGGYRYRMSSAIIIAKAAPYSQPLFP